MTATKYARLADEELADYQATFQRPGYEKINSIIAELQERRANGERLRAALVEELARVWHDADCFLEWDSPALPEADREEARSRVRPHLIAKGLIPPGKPEHKE